MFSDQLEKTLPVPVAPAPVPAPVPTQTLVVPKSGLEPTILYLGILVIVLLSSILYHTYWSYFENSHLKKDIGQLQSQFEKSISESESESK